MTNTKKKKSARDKRVLIASIICAGLIVAGSTFAWFTSQDEVTNRLSASANYNVTIAEDFTPPENWIPGQEVEKKVGVVNAGNIDAFTRVWLEGEMNILKQTTSSAVATAVPTGTTATTDSDLLAMGLKYYDATNKLYYRILGTTERANPALNGTDTGVNDDTYDEVKAVQAGGWLAYASDGAAFKFTPEQRYEYIDTDSNKVVGDANVELSSTAIKPSWREGEGLAIDSDTFTPTATGLYIFRRNINQDTTSDGYNYEYSGYFYDATKKEYYALEYTPSANSDYVIDPSLLTITYSNADDTTSPVVSVADNGIKLFTAAYTEVKNDQLKWFYSDDGTNKALHAFYDVDNDNAFDDNDILVDVALDNVTNAGGQGWTVASNAGVGASADKYTGADLVPAESTADNKAWTFYYGDDLEEGDTTAKLVDSVTLNSAVTQNAYLAFDFDLNVFMDSVQVTVDNTGNETFDSVSGGWASTNANVTAAKASATVGAPEINTITWAKNG